MRRVLVVNGPNLNLLGTRRQDMYGSTALEELEDAARTWGKELGLDVETFQSNHEGELIDRIHAAHGEIDGLVINPGALTHYSYALHDAVEAVEVPAVEVHISNVEERETWRRLSVVRPACVYTIYGRGVDGYRWALRHLAYRAAWPFETVSYGDLADQVLDLRVPRQDEPEELAVLVHGGFWRHPWTRDLMDGLAVDLTRRGLVTANLEYRRVGKGGGWPVTAEDVTAGIRRAREVTGVERVTVLGHSAGGHLTLLAVQEVAAEVEVRAVSLAGVTDLVAALAEGIGNGAAAEFLRDEPPEPASPLHRLPLGAPAVAVHGTGDDRVPVSYSRRYAEAAEDEVTLEVLEGVGHFEFLDPDGPVWEGVADLVLGP